VCKMIVFFETTFFCQAIFRNMFIIHEYQTRYSLDTEEEKNRYFVIIWSISETEKSDFSDPINLIDYNSCKLAGKFDIPLANWGIS